MVEDSAPMVLSRPVAGEYLVSLKKRVIELEKENSLLMKVVEAREEFL